jgi:hypothetical protein
MIQFRKVRLFNSFYFFLQKRNNYSFHTSITDLQFLANTNLLQNKMNTVVTSTSEYPLDEWLATVRECKFLPENDLKKLCDLVRHSLHFLLTAI